MKALKYLLIAGSLVFFASQLFASERAIISVERPHGSHPQSFYVNVMVDHKNHLYEAGDLMQVTVESSRAGYLYLFYKDAGGNVTLLFPNNYHSDNRIEGNKKVLIPNATMDFDLKTMAPFGKETLQAIVSLKPIEESSLTNFQDGQTFKELSSRQLGNLKEKMTDAIGVVGRDRQQTIENDLADCTIEITTYSKGQTPVIQNKRIFVGICVAKYADTRIRQLPACEKDLEEMGRFFNSRPEIDTNSSIVYINEEATKAKIKDLFFNYLPDKTNIGDEIIIYWTGHGARCSDMNHDEDDGYDETLILYDSESTDPDTQLIDDDFGKWVQNLSGRKILFIFDTCHSGGLGEEARSMEDSNSLTWDFGVTECAQVKDLGQDNLALIASCAKSELSLVRLEKDMSVMTWYIMKHLKNESGLTHKALYKKIKSEVSDYVEQARENSEQTVVIQDEFDSPMVLN